MRIHSKSPLCALLLALSATACGSLFPDSAPISYWALRPAEVALDGVKVLNVAPRMSLPEARLAERVRDDLRSTERFNFDGGVTQAMLNVGAQAMEVTTKVESETAQQGLTTLTRYTRYVSYTLRGTLQVVDAMTSAELGNVRRDLPVAHACGTATVPGMPPPNGQEPDPSVFAQSPNCEVSVEALAGMGRMLAQSLVPHYEMETATLWTEDLEHAKEAVAKFSKGNWTEAEAMLRVDLETANAKGDRARQAKAGYNLAVLLNATGQVDRAGEQLKDTPDGLRDDRAWELAELSIKRAQTARAQANTAGYTPHHLPAL